MQKITLHRDGRISIGDAERGQWHRVWPERMDRGAIRYYAVVHLSSNHHVRTPMVRWGALKEAVQAALDSAGDYMPE